MSRVPLLLHPFLSAGSPQAWAAAATALPLTPQPPPGTPPLPPWIQLLGWAASRDSACGQHDQGRKEGPPRSSPRQVLPDPCDLTSTPGHTPGPRIRALHLHDYARRGRSRRQPARLHSLEGWQGRGQGTRQRVRGGSHGEARDTSGARRPGEVGPTNGGVHTPQGGRGWVGPLATAGVRGGGEGGGGAGPPGAGRARGRGPQRFRKARDGVAEPKEASARPLPLPARGAPALWPQSSGAARASAVHADAVPPRRP